MLKNVSNVLPLSNLGSAAPVTEVNGLVTIFSAMNAVLREKFGRKTWAYLALLTKLEERTAKHRLACTRPYDFADLVNLLRSEIGFFILKAIMGADKKRWPAWFSTCDRAMRRKELIDDIKQYQIEFEAEEALLPTNKR